jgi:sugar lactone lactonase YvrE
MATRCTSWLLLLTGMHLSAQYVINTVAGGGAPQNVPATSVGIGRPAHIAVDGSGNIYIASDTQNRIYKVDATGTLTTVAGNSGMASASDPGIGPALNTAVYPGSIALDQAGNLYIAGLDCCVLKINNGVIARADGNGTRGFSGDGGPASSAAINPPAGIVFDSAGNLYLSDIFTQRIRKISNGVITTVAGNGTQGFSGDGATATAASLGLVASSGLAVDSQRNLYIADSVNYRIRKVTNGIITTIAGGGTSFADNIPATSAMLGSVGDIAVDAAGNLYISNSGSGPAYFPREVMNGTITTFTNSAAYVSSFAADNTGNLYFADYSNQVRRISNGVATIVAGNGDGSYIGDGTVATNAGLATPNSVAVDRAGNVYIADSGNHRIRRVTGGQITTVATTTTNANQCSGCPGAVAVDGSGNVYFTDGFQVRVISNGVITTVAGNGSGSYSGDGGPATSAGVFPTALAVDSQNDLYIADVYRIRKVSQGVITTVAGNGTPGSCATPVLATGASVANYVAGVSIDSSGNIYFANSNAGMGEVCRVSNGTATSVANSSTPGFRNPSGIARDQLGNVFIVSPGIVWKLSNGILTNIAGTPSSYNVLGYSGDGGPGTSATLGTMISSGLAVDIASNIYVADSGNNRVRILSPTGFGSPFGSFDTPLDNTTGVAGAIPVTGWALDKVGVSKVQVWREPVGNEPVASNNLVFVGDAVQVAGTRPDVQALYPTMPFNNRAGWGYMLLTNFLPSTSGPAGNGTYKLHAIATNNAGGQTDLGTRTIVVDNVHASKPFGTIDTPGQGDAISGNAYVNFGWALTQNPYCIPTDGHTITVAIDGVLGGHPTYNQNRSDIATLFPGLCNSNGAVGFFYIDTTTLANGVHTISWVVYDNQGRGDGIGSRYFTVQNAGNIAAPQESALAALKASPRQGRPYIIEVEELDRIELDLGAISSEPLPVGSTLKNGVFYWQLGPGFLGEYQFRFTRPDGSSALVQVKVHPKSYNRY